MRTCITRLRLQGRAAALAIRRGAGVGWEPPRTHATAPLLKTAFVFPDSLAPDGPQLLIGINCEDAKRRAAKLARQIAQRLSATRASIA